ncbi:PAS domain S-box protein [Halosolutus gelatinilyticus]|uniref:PAS domain S-box protein n=1 Tax=Halosolutus gelatinilyticus TaxID=2931975 RepID=UPI001FF6A372|nr:PAS domain S-box protein [Halosolutus gelatinilyticus]
MNRGVASAETLPIRVLVVGSSAWTRDVSTTLESDVTVHGPIAELDGEELASTDCVLTDDRTALSDLEDHPALFVVDGERDVDGILADGADDVFPVGSVDDPSLLAHRLRETIRYSSATVALERREEWYRALIERSSDLLAVLSESGRVTYVSPSVEREIGTDPADLLGSSVLENVHPDDRDAVVETFDAVRADEPGTSRTVEYRYRTEDAGWGVYEAALTNRLEDSIVGGVVVSVRDVTQFHRVEEELAKSFERVTDAFYALDTDWRFTYVNTRAEELLGYSREELLGNDIRELFPHGHRSELYDRFEHAIAEQESVSWERYSESLDIWMEISAYPSETGLSVYFRDISERVEREQELTEGTERLQALVENAPIVLYVLDSDGAFTLSEGRGLENIGVESAEIVGESAFDVFKRYPAVRRDVTAALDGESVHSQRRIRDRVFEAWHQPVARNGDVDRVIGVAVDVTERVQYQETLNALHEATSHLLTVESKQAACEYIVDVATDVLDIDSVVYRFDDQHNELLPAAYATGLEATIGRPPRLEPDAGPAWDAFVSGTPSVVDDLDPDERGFAEEADVRSGLYVPLGEHGVLVALSTERAGYDDDTAELADLFATTAEVALDRIGRARRLHDRERELKRQNIHLERLNHANQVRQDIEQLLLLADSRDEIEEGICDRLVELESCSLAWIGDPDPGGSQIRPRVQSGLDRGYLDSMTATTVDDTAAEPTGRSARSRSPTYVENVADSVRDGAWRAEALSRNFQSVYAVPLVYDGFLYGVLSIYGDDRDVFDETLRSTVAELGETIAYSIDAVKRKNALGDDDRTEVELELEAESTLCRLASRLDARLEFEGATSRADGSTIVFVAADSGLDADDVEDAAAVDGLADVSVIASGDEEILFQCRLTGPFLDSIVDAHGATLRGFSTDGSRARAIVDVPDAIEIRELLSEIGQQGFAASMVARREQSATARAPLDAHGRNALLETLTDRQREVVQTAYHGGFFAWPRNTTGEAIADSLGISPPAFHKHVRSVEQKLFRALFDNAVVEGGLNR